MEIKKQGVVPKYEYECWVCGCQFEVKFTELERHEYLIDERGYPHLTRVEAICPTCGVLLVK